MIRPGDHECHDPLHDFRAGDATPQHAKETCGDHGDRHRFSAARAAAAPSRIALGVVAGCAVAYPINVWMGSRGMKHGLMTDRSHAGDLRGSSDYKVITVL